jgi:hypothetical protein
VESWQVWSWRKSHHETSHVKHLNLLMTVSASTLAAYMKQISPWSIMPWADQFTAPLTPPHL